MAYILVNDAIVDLFTTEQEYKDCSNDFLVELYSTESDIVLIYDDNEIVEVSDNNEEYLEEENIEDYAKSLRPDKKLNSIFWASDMEQFFTLQNELKRRKLL